MRFFLLLSALSVETWAQIHTCSHSPSPKAHGGLTLRDLTSTVLWVSLPMSQHCWSCKECFTFYKPLGTMHWLCFQAHEVGFLALYIHLYLLWLNRIWNTGPLGLKHCNTLSSQQFLVTATPKVFTIPSANVKLQRLKYYYSSWRSAHSYT